MKATNTINRVSDLNELLEKLFDLLNEEIFEGQLPKAVITLSPTKRFYGHYTPYDAWNVHAEAKREINISTYDINRPIKDVIGTLIHEMCHMYNDLILGVKDFSNHGRYHNKHFKKAAESHWLIVKKSNKYGWSITEPNEKLINWINEHPELSDIEMYKRNYKKTEKTDEEEKNEKKQKRKTNRFKFIYKCPNCGCECKSTARMQAFCIRCKHQML